MQKDTTRQWRLDYSMKKSDVRNQILIVASVLVLFFAAYYFDVWQDWLKGKFNETLAQPYIALKLWSVPLAALFFSVCWLIVFQTMRKHNSKLVAVLLLATGISILMYPTVSMTFFMTQAFGIPVDYFGDSLFFYSSAFVSAMGIIGLSSGIVEEKNQSI